MKKICSLLLLLLFSSIANAQDIYPKNIGDSLVIITADQLKDVNLIFLEHSYLIDENNLLLEKLDVKDEMIFNYQKMDSINRANVIKLTNELEYSKNKVDNLTKKLNAHKKYFWIGGSALVASILAFFLK